MPATTLPPTKVFARYDGGPPSLAPLALDLLSAQRETWDQLAAGVASLATVRVREIRCDGYSVNLQFNPGRIVSTSAKVDAATIRERRCFLCIENLPLPQQGILYRDTFLVLCNPAPIFLGHYTVSHVEHRPQRLDGNLLAFLMLARDFSPKFTVFYNGPKCGASAPDHLHFQVSPSGEIPIERLAVLAEHQRTVFDEEGIRVSRLGGVGRAVILVEGDDTDGIAAVLTNLMDRMKAVLGDEGEAKVNILCAYDDGRWRLIIFPRGRHRPEAFFREGDNRVMISPAAVDIGGLVITPLERDFLRTDAALIRQIFAEVSVSDQQLDEILGAA